MPVACKFIEKETLLQVFKFCETFKNTVFNRTPHVQSTSCTRIAAFRPINNIIKYYSYCIILIRIDTILSKNIKDKFQNLLFKKLINRNRHILEILLAYRHTLVAQNSGTSVKLHHNLTTPVFFIHHFLLIFATQLIETKFYLF